MVNSNSKPTKIQCRKCKRHVYLTPKDVESLEWQDVKKSRSKKYTHSAVCNLCFEREYHAVSPGRDGSSGD